MDRLYIRCMQLTRAPNNPWPNLFIFPKELRDVIPNYGACTLVVDEVLEVLSGASASAKSRDRLQFFVYETEGFKAVDCRSYLILTLQRCVPWVNSWST